MDLSSLLPSTLSDADVSAVAALLLSPSPPSGSPSSPGGPKGAPRGGPQAHVVQGGLVVSEGFLGALVEALGPLAETKAKEAAALKGVSKPAVAAAAAQQQQQQQQQTARAGATVREGGGSLSVSLQRMRPAAAAAAVAVSCWWW